MTKHSVTIPKFKGGGEFAVELKRRVEEYFAVNNIDKTGDWRLFSKTIILFVLFFLTYYLLVFTELPWWGNVPLCMFLGILSAGIGFCVMHDAIHGGYSKSKRLNHLLGFSLNFLGGNNTLWEIKHNNIHHANTNVDGYDEDIEAQPALKLHPNQKWLPVHKYQHRAWYWIPVYSMLYVVWVWWNDYQKYFTGRILYKTGIKFSLSEHIIFWISKVFYFVNFVVIPILYVGFWYWLVGYLIVMFTCSLLISVVFQLAHVVENLDHPTIEHGYPHSAEHQIATTADFATNSKLLTWYLGGLNFQIEHHLFPKISHVHYPALHRILRDLCNERKVRLTVYPTFFLALRSHVSTLKLFGRKPVIA